MLPTNLRAEFVMFKNCWHLVNYSPGCNDAISRSIISYKQQDPTIVERWNNLALKQITKLDIQPDCIIRALSSSEMVCSGEKPLDQLCNNLAKHYGITYNPSLMMKKDFTSPLHNMPKKQRNEALHNQYIFNLPATNPQPTKMLIIDDILTTGATMQAIRQAIRQVVKRTEIYFFVLARTSGKW